MWSRTLLSPSVPIKRNSAKHDAFPLASSSSFRAFGTEKGLIHLYQAGKTIPGVSIGHGFSNFVGHQPCSSVLFYVQEPLHLRKRYSHLIHRHMVNHPIPLHQRSSRCMEDRACRDACLGTTPFAIEQMPPGKIPSSFIPALGANKSFRPPQCCKMPRTGIVIRKFPLKLYQTPLFVFLGHFPPCPRIYPESL